MPLGPTIHLTPTTKPNFIMTDKITINSLQQTKPGIVIGSVEIYGKQEIIQFEFSDNVLDYLTLDRCDALVIGLLMFAIRQGLDIESSLPISESLYYKLTHHYISGLCGEKMHQPKIIADIIPDAEHRGNIIATGISCGVDSLYTIKEHTIDTTPNLRLNHLVFLNSGSHHLGAGASIPLYEGRRKLAYEACQSLNMPIIEISSNFPDLLNRYGTYDHVEQSTFMMLMCIKLIQSGIHRYYYSSGYPYHLFQCQLEPNYIIDSAYFDLLTLWIASNCTQEYFSTGGAKTRFEKVQALASYAPSENYLNVCVATVKNCGECFKCKRTLLELDAAGTLDAHTKVFNIEKYKSERTRRIKEGYRGMIKGDTLLRELKPFFMQELSPATRSLQRARVLCGRLTSIFR